jgi:hypothetical protein
MMTNHNLMLLKEAIVVMAFDLVKNCFKNNFEAVVLNAAFPDLMVCLCEFSKNGHYQKIRYIRKTCPCDKVMHLSFIFLQNFM